MNINSLTLILSNAQRHEYKPNIVIIKFGANDANKKNFEKYGKETFKADYKKLIAKFQALSTKPDIYICMPPPMYYGDGGFLGSFDDNVAKNYIQPAVREIAEELNLVCVDLYNPLKDIRNLCRVATIGCIPTIEGIIL